MEGGAGRFWKWLCWGRVFFFWYYLLDVVTPLRSFQFVSPPSPATAIFSLLNLLFFSYFFFFFFFFFFVWVLPCG
jgi:hypothetical protein